MVKYKSSREMMQAMNEGKISRQHLGVKNYYVLKQEIFSLKNEYNPNTSTEAEQNDWNIQIAARLEEVEQLTGSDQKTLLKEIDKMLDPSS